MGRYSKSSAAGTGVEQACTRVQRLPRIFHVRNHDALSLREERLTAVVRRGFDHICLNPFATRRNSPLLVLDLDRPHPRLGQDLDDVLKALSASCQRQGLTLCLDVVLDRLAAEGASARAAGDLFTSHDGEEVIDPRRDQSLTRAAIVRSDAGDRLAAWWGERLQRLAASGAGAFRLLGLDHLPAGCLPAIAAAVRPSSCSLFAWTPGLDWSRHRELAQAGVDAVFASTAWWDGKADWYVEELDSLAHVAPVIGVVADPVREITADAQSRRRLLQIAEATTDGLLVPEGFEAGLEDALCEGVGQAEARGAVRRLASASTPVTAFVRLDTADPREAKSGQVILINTDRRSARPLPILLDPLVPASGAVLGAPRMADGSTVPDRLQPGDVQVVEVRSIAPVVWRRPPNAVRVAATRSPVVIDRVSPEVEGFAARRIVGRPVTVEANIFTDGHDLLAAELQWRAIDETEWQRVPMVLLSNDRWQAAMTPRRMGRHVFTIEAWRDEYGSMSHGLELKHRAGVDLEVDIADALAYLRNLGLGQLVAVLAGADEATSVALLTSVETRRQVREAAGRTRAVRHPDIALDVERPQAEFASWYELFPRSLGTFDDVIAHLPRVRAMGFDVLYFPPIHPIGQTNRKGRNNSLKPAPDDPGSPYAIGSKEGGHDAIHPELGTPEDFRRLVAAAHAEGLEIAIDFAIQCSPDHPWLREHPEWFKHRADGTIRYAENPPKKYEDIVNVDFYGDGAVPDLWLALRDVVLFWAGEGVRIFRVDNPHTKPLPFWEWMIADVRSRHPDAIFLAEAFTRPAMMYRLAKVGFTQSYTYFTWRTGKAEITDYLTELTTTSVADYYRPHFFVNTPDINPVFLQTSGRAGFLIRAALAATLAGLWGVYSGFEICEAAPLPGREEYLDSEKYQVRHRDFAAPGNIVGEITALNRLRRLHPALQSHLGLRFYNAFNDQVLLYGKLSPGGEEMTLVAVSLDPHAVQEATFEVPLWEWKMPDNGSVEVEDLMRGHRFAWHGKEQRLRLDPADLPFAIWRIAPAGAHP